MWLQQEAFLIPHLWETGDVASFLLHQESCIQVANPATWDSASSDCVLPQNWEALFQTSACIPVSWCTPQRPSCNNSSSILDISRNICEICYLNALVTSFSCSFVDKTSVTSFRSFWDLMYWKNSSVALVLIGKGRKAQEEGENLRWKLNDSCRGLQRVCDRQGKAAHANATAI